MPPVSIIEYNSTVLPANSDSYVMFVNKVIRDLYAIDHLCINHRINTQVVYRLALAQVVCTHKLKFYLYDCKQNITSLLLLVGTTVKPCTCFYYLFLYFSGSSRGYCWWHSWSRCPDHCCCLSDMLHRVSEL